MRVFPSRNQTSHDRNNLPVSFQGMDASTINALMAEMEPDEIQAIPHMVDVWLRVGWLEPDEAVEWQLGASAWAEFHRMSPGAETS